MARSFPLMEVDSDVWQGYSKVAPAVVDARFIAPEKLSEHVTKRHTWRDYAQGHDFQKALVFGMFHNLLKKSSTMALKSSGFSILGI